VKLGSRSTAQEALQGASLVGKTVIITGASSGIGVETAKALSSAGAHVVLAVRNVAAGEAVAKTLASSSEVRALDLSDLNSVRAFAKAWGARPVDLLINNAGLMGLPPSKTPQGFETHIGTNHLGHFLLTTQLLPCLQPGARVVTVSSRAHKRATRERMLAGLQKKPTPDYTPMGVYGDSKLANALFTRALAKRLPAGMTAFAVHPGTVVTNITQGLRLPGLIVWAFRAIGPFIFKVAEQGASTTVYAALAPELADKSGAYLADCAIAETNADGSDLELAEQVWALSERAVAES
jgi:NAD(P)-dependent dehydrogenase (short-subunit alcohol dehydrogenase family)